MPLLMARPANQYFSYKGCVLLAVDHEMGLDNGVPLHSQECAYTVCMRNCCSEILDIQALFVDLCLVQGKGMQLRDIPGGNLQPLTIILCVSDNGFAYRECL